MGLLNIVKKDPVSIGFVKRSCKDNCKWRCDFDKNGDVFCHFAGQDLTLEQIYILQLVGCSSWKQKDNYEELKNAMSKTLTRSCNDSHV